MIKHITSLLVVLFMMPVFNVSAQQCDPVILEKALDNEYLKYRERDNRCEGLYGTGVSSRLEIVGLTQGQFQYKLNADDVIKIVSPIVIDQPVNVRAVGIPSATYYRMDALIEPGGTLVWPVADVLDVEKLPARNVGVFGWIGDRGIERYVPIAVTTTANPVNNDGQIRLTLRPGIDVKNVQWSVSEVVDDVCSQLGDRNKLQKSLYREGQPIKIILPESDGGELCVEVKAQSQKHPDTWETKLIRVVVGRK